MSPTNKNNPDKNNPDDTPDKKKPAQQPADPNSRRQRLRAEQEKAAREARVRKIITFGGLGVVVLAVIGLVTWGVISATNAAKPINKVNATYAVVIGKESAPVTLDVYQDFMCPVCGEFEKANSDDITRMVDDGTVLLRIHPMNFLDDASLGTKYSTRAANAFVTVWKAEPDKALAFNKLMFANQPKENTTGLTDAQIAQIASQAGVSASVIDTFAKGENTDFPTNTTNAAFASGVTGTPTVLIDGTKFTGNLFTPGVLGAAIEQAVKSS